MTTRSYRGDAPAVAKVIVIPAPIITDAGEIEIKINNKTVSYPNWDLDALVIAWNSAGYPETSAITASARRVSDGSYGYSEALVLTANTPGEDFFVKAYINNNLVRTNEVQVLTFFPSPTGGTFTLTYDGQTTGAITFVDGDIGTTEANIKAGLEGLSNVAVGDVLVDGTSDDVYTITFQSNLAETDVPLMTINYNSLTGGDFIASVVTVIEGALGTNEVQILSLPSSPTGGTFTITYSGQTTGAIAYNANAATVEAALIALSNIGATDVACTGGALPGTPITITFQNDLGSQNVALMTANGASLTGGSANVSGFGTDRDGSAAVNNIHAVGLPQGGGSTPNTPRWVRWQSYYPTNNLYSQSDILPHTATLAELKAALVGMTVPISGVAYVLEEDDIELTGDLMDRLIVSYSGTSSTYYSGGVQVEFKGNLAGMSIPYMRQANSITMQVGQNSTMTHLTQNYDGEVQAASVSYEIQHYTVDDRTIVGSYTLTVYDIDGDPHTTDPINYSDLQDIVAIRINDALGGDYVSVSGSYSTPAITFTINYRYNGYQQTNMTQLSLAGENSGQSAVVTLSVSGMEGTSEVQTISFSSVSGFNLHGGSYTITYEGQTTGSIAYDADSLTIQLALEALSNIAVEDVLVSGGPPTNDITLTWKNTLGDVSEPTLTLLLDNAEATIETTVPGGVSIDTLEEQMNRGPQCFDDPLNYDPEGRPSDLDTILFEFGIDHCRWGTKQRDTFTVDATTNVCTLSVLRPLFRDGQKLRVYSSTTLPAGLSANTAYYIINADNIGNFQLSTSEGGTAINITDTGTGTHTICLHLTSLVKPARYSYDIGLPRTNSAGFEEYRPRYLEADINTIELGKGTGSDSSLVRIDTGSKPTAITVYNTGSGAEQEVPAAAFLVNDSTSDIIAYGGEIGIAPFLDETATVRDITAFDTIVKSVGGTVCEDITMDQGSTLVGSFTPSGVVNLGV